MKYGVSIPVVGFVYSKVDAESEDEAIEKSFDNEYKCSDIEEWDLYKNIVTGNVLHVPLNSAEAEELDEYDD